MESEFFVLCLISSHLTSLHLTSSHLTSPHLISPHLNSPHLTSSYFVICSHVCFDFIHPFNLLKCFPHSRYLSVYTVVSVAVPIFFCLRIFCFVLILFSSFFSNIVIFNSCMMQCSILCVICVFLYIVRNLKIQRSGGVRELLHAHTSPQYDMRLNVLVMCHVGRAAKPMLSLYFLALFGLHFSHDEGTCFTPIFNLFVDLTVTKS